MRYLIDIGSGILRQLAQHGTEYSSLDAVFITHTHSDHIGDLAALVHALRLPVLKRDKPLHIFGPPGFIDFFNAIVRPVAEPTDKFPFFIEEVKESWSMEGLAVKTCPTLHSERFESVAYRFEADGKSVVFSGDCDYAPEIIALAEAADLFICDCSNLADDKCPGHLAADEVSLVAKEAGVRHLVPTHFYPIQGPDSLWRKECSMHYSGKITLAEDFLEFRL